MKTKGAISDLIVHNRSVRARKPSYAGGNMFGFGETHLKVSRKGFWLAPIALAWLFAGTGCTGTASKASSQTPNAPTGAQLQADSNSVNFGQVVVGTSSTKNVTLTDAGSNVTISSIEASGSGFAVTQPSLPASLTVGQTMVVAVSFDPTASGQHTGSLTISSNSSNPQLVVALSGTTTSSPASHSATISWDNGDPTAPSYRVYRSSVSGGPYVPLNSSPISATTYADSTVAANATYFYVVTEINSVGVESPFSSEVSTTVP